MTAPHTGGQHLALADYIIVLGADGRVAEQGSFEQLRIAGSPIAKLDSGPASTEQNTEVADQQAGGGDTTNSADESEVDTLQSPDLSVWKYYFKAMGWTNILLFCLFVAVDSAASSVSYVWITWWSASPDAAPASNLGYWLGIYAMFGVLSLTGLGLGVYWTWVVIVPTASRTLHAAVLSATMGASISFLSKTDTGMLINRFSQDMRLVDMVLPRGFVSTGFHFFGAIAQAAVAISALPYLAPAIPVVGAVLFLIQRFYLRTSRQLRLLDIEMKAPVFSHFIESLHGLMTIRAFGWKPQYLARSISLLDAAQRPYYLLLAIQRWLTLVLNLVVAGLAILMVGLSLALRHRVQPGLLGVALVMMTDLGRAMADLIQNWTLLETSLGAISRIKDFSENTPQEEGGDGSAPTQSLPAGGGGGGEWPSSGAIEFSSVYARHDAAGQPVLKDINVAIAPGQKVGICGRTGSGKSSLMMSLLRLVQVESGRVAIDGVDIATIPPTLLRERLNCMTQEPFIFGGTVRENADPLEERSDAEILAALEAVGVLDVIASKTEECGPLERKMDEKLLSHGQKQLFAVARSLLRGGKVLLLDEPTSRYVLPCHWSEENGVTKC
jgi:ABC-type multidrug transport system fused ATPase/permease subunit